MLINSLKISDTTKTEPFKLKEYDENTDVQI